MKMFPEFRIGFFNGWIPLGVYFLGLVLSILPYSREARIWLFQNPVNRGNKRLLVIRSFGQLTMVAFILMMIATPLTVRLPAFAAGTALFLAGWIMEISGLYFFRVAPPGWPVAAGPYRISRNPQWVGLFLVLLGSALAAGVWLYIVMVLMAGVSYHIQILDEEALCIRRFGESYLSYMEKIPRYFLFV
jgi:hypothetical protein